MKKNWQLAAGPLAALTAFFCVGLCAPVAHGQAVEGSPLLARNFSPSGLRGFGDRNNSWPQAMTWWNGNLYVGTSRQSLCTSLAGIYQYAKFTVGQAFADQWLPYPPPDPDLSCATDWADLSLQAEIWRWSPNTNSWSRVFQSPSTLPNPGPGSGQPPRLGKTVPYEIAFRGFAPFTEANGTQALYAFGVNSTILWDRTQLPPPRILRTTDGVTWTPVPQAPGTFLGTLPFNPDHSSFRSPVVVGGKMFALSGPIFGQGNLIGSADPGQGNNAWFLGANVGTLFYELASFNGMLYLGGFDVTNGYTIYKTNVSGPPPYALTTVVPPGAFLTVRPSKSVVSMQVHYGRLYVGTATQTELIRINPDDTWDLVLGVPRQVPSTGEWKYPISNLDAGFGHTLNDHAWQMEDPYNYFYVGTYNASTGARLDPLNGPKLLHNMGAHLYRTPDDWYYSPVMTNGFADQNGGDTKGGKFDFGIRTMASTPYGVFVGTTNDYYGLRMFFASKRTSPPVGAPDRLDVEQTRTGTVLLSWLAGFRAVSYRIMRAEINPIYVRDDVSFENWNGISGNKIPDTYVGPYQQVGTTSATYFIDTTTVPGKRYMYYIIGVGATGALSDPSSLVTYPLLMPEVTFATVQRDLDRLVVRQRYIASDPLGNTVRQQVATAKVQAAACQIAAAIATITPKPSSRTALVPDSVDVEVILSRLVRRLQLYNLLPTQVQTSEFCTP